MGSNVDSSGEDEIVAMSSTDTADDIEARGELCEILDRALADQAAHGEGSMDDDNDAIAGRVVVCPHVDVPGRGQVSKYTLVIELNKRKSVGKNGDSLAKLDPSRLRRVKQVSKEAGKSASRETTDALVSE
jgi:hypothetical protein